MTKRNVSHEDRVEATPQQPSSLSPMGSGSFIVVRCGGAPVAVNLNHVRCIVAWLETDEEERFTRLVFVGEPAQPNESEGEFPFLVDESLEELLERVGAVL